MKRLLALLTLILLASPAMAINQSGIPPKFNIPWGNSAGSAYIRSIPQNSQIGIQNCAASLTDGFPPLTFVPATAGGCPPFGQDFNGILKQLSQWNQWQSAGGPVIFDSGFSSTIGGYPKGAILTSTTPGSFWLSTVDGNTSNPDAAGAGWLSFSPVNRYAVDSGSANAIVANFSPAPASLASLIGQPLTIKITNATTSNSPTVTINGFSSVTAVSPDGSKAPLISAGAMVIGVYDGTNFQITSVSNFQQPTFIKLTASSGTVTIGAFARQIHVRMVAGGAGGGGNGSSVQGSGQQGTATSFAGGSNTVLGGGSGGANVGTSGGLVGAGGSGGISTLGTEIVRTSGGTGLQGWSTGAALTIGIGGGGAASCFGQGSVGTYSTGQGTPAPGAGGAGNGVLGSSTIGSGSGGGAGECDEFIIPNPAASYTFTVGPGGAGGTGGAGGGAGLPGGNGLILVEVDY